MKYFTDPNGQFVIKVPIEWQYSNVAAGYKEESPFSFAPYDDPESAGAFQISCYPANERTPKNNIQPSDKDNLAFIEKRMDDDEANIHLWFCTVENHVLMAKYIYLKKHENTNRIREEMIKVKIALSKTAYISKDNRARVLALDRYYKFQAALAASFDLKESALKSGSLIEFILIIASQIDSYLRLCIVMRKQLKNKSDELEQKYFYQGEKCKPITEREIYKEAKSLEVISEEIFDRLSRLYDSRNRIVHRFIISDIRTRDLVDIAIDYDDVSEKIRLDMRELENLQRKAQVGIYKNSATPGDETDKDEVRFLFANINDKHLLEKYKREV
ncbi:MAG: hypothetical protein KJ884_03305 [Gammaproteobacteria bacterium]|nr:hypothetical protein [Gammaproteobacteria bacterium]MBU1489667.1 hypothetical protein [Gammaproteobacteria bacterium]MBU2067019.1 hypothetical protein [Gammaproteobacteria bacterium]MBU2137544.1 hypothetical protein [Gammaproteobacteria bacterium]MBU2216391.1 hypothetical protein [Gammaproteobacteria bacterium]